MNLLIKIFSFVLFYSLLLSCNTIEKSKTDALNDFLQKKNVSLKDKHSILVLSEIGCVNCNRKYSVFLENQLANNKNLILISAKGVYVDISPYYSLSGNNNVFHDFKNEFSDLNIARGSLAILLNDNKEIDTVVEIKLQGLDSTLNYLKEELQ